MPVRFLSLLYTGLCDPPRDLIVLALARFFLARISLFILMFSVSRRHPRFNFLCHGLALFLKLGKPALRQQMCRKSALVIVYLSGALHVMNSCDLF